MARDEAYRQTEQLIEFARQEEATKLDLSEMELTEVPEAIGSLTQLQMLALSYNQLTALPEAIAGGDRLYEADIRVGLAWMHRAAGNIEAARREAVRAQRMSEAMSYYWGKQDAAEVLEALEADS